MPPGGDNVRTGEGERARVQKLERALGREFSVICFAWDGTAVARRDADASAVATSCSSSNEVASRRSSRRGPAGPTT